MQKTSTQSIAEDVFTDQIQYAATLKQVGQEDPPPPPPQSSPKLPLHLPI